MEYSGGFKSLNDDELNDIRQLIDHMQSSLVELFDQLRELRERLHLVTGLPADMFPSIVPLFSEIKPLDDTVELEPSESIKEENSNPDTHSESLLQEITDTTDEKSPITDSSDSSSSSAKVSRVLDPIARELRTGEATADIILEYLQAAKEYLIDDDEKKKKVARDMDIVLNFLKARGKRAIRIEERDNILKRIRRWKAHLVS